MEMEAVNRSESPARRKVCVLGAERVAFAVLQVPVEMSGWRGGDGVGLSPVTVPLPLSPPLCCLEHPHTGQLFAQTTAKLTRKKPHLFNVAGLLGVQRSS